MTPRGRLRRVLPSHRAAWLVVAWCSTLVAAAQQSDAPVRILIDQPPRAVEYQLGRLTNDELARIERHEEARYRLVYVALLTRKSLARGLRDEALAALVKIDRATATQILLEALSKIPAEDDPTANALAAMLIGQPVDTLRSERDALIRAMGASDVSPALRAAYAALIIADGSLDASWQAAGQRAGHLTELLNGAPLLPADAAFDPLRIRLAASIATLLLTPQPAVDADTRAAAVRALQGLPDRAWPSSQVEGLARAMIAFVTNLAPDRRTEPRATEAVQLAERLVALLPEPARSPLHRELRALGVQVVEIATLPEQMQFTVKWFAVERAKPVQIVFVNPDAMPHNLVVGRPGSLEKLGAAAMTMDMPSDPAVKPYVPAGPLVLQATALVKEGDTERLNFTAPAGAGEYVFACTFPGHWVRMYGVMLVVDNLEAWEAAPTTPIDPITGRPFISRR
jgi:azurin